MVGGGVSKLAAIQSSTCCFHFWSILAPYFLSVLIIKTRYINPRKKIDVMPMRTPSAPRGESEKDVPASESEVEDPVRQTNERILAEKRTSDLVKE
jgi:hypothetical protein